MFCAAITFSHYFHEYKTGGLFCPPVKSLEGAKQPPGFMFLEYSITFLAHKTCRCILGCIAYIFNRGVDASQANLLKNALDFYAFKNNL